MSETNQEQSHQEEEENFEFNENELQNHEEDIENQDGQVVQPPNENELQNQFENEESNPENPEHQYSDNNESGSQVDGQEIENDEDDANLNGSSDQPQEMDSGEASQSQEQLEDENEEIKDVEIIEPEENSTKDITEMTVEELKKELDKSITRLDFQRAQEIQNEIDSRSSQNHSEFLDEHASKFIDSCTKIAKTHFKEKRKLQNAYLEDEVKERTKMKDGFQEIKKGHIEQLKKLENELFNIYKKQMKNPITAYDDLIERAKLTAKRGDFQTAQDYQLQAQRAKEEEEEKRENQFKEEYKARMSALLDRQSQEISDFAFYSNNEISKVLKIRDKKISEQNEKFKRSMNREYRKTCDFITHSRYDPRNPSQQAIDPKIKPSLLNRIEDEYNIILAKYGLQSVEFNKPKMIAPNIRPESQMSVRMQSRVEMREAQKKKKDDEHYTRTNSRMSTSFNASRSGSKQASPKASPRSGYNPNNSRKSNLSPTRY